MKIFHIIKKEKQDTIFRQIMLDALKRVQNILSHSSNRVEFTVYIASGFFDSNVSAPKIDIFHYNDPKTGASLFNLLANLNVEILGAYNSRRSLQVIKQILQNQVARLNVYYKNNFHAKIFVISANGTPVFEIIGSSNMTTRAYEGIIYKKGTFQFSPNTEADLVLLNDILPLGQTGKNFDFDLEANEDIMKLSYVPEENQNISFESRMLSIVDYLENLKQTMKKI